MKQGLLTRSAFAAVLTLAFAGPVIAADADKSSPILAKSPPATSAPASTATCTDASGKPVTDPSVCTSGMCKDASGKPVADASACAASVSESSRSTGYDLKKATK
ncbi:MAG: hypothetical protein AB7O49_10220 [Sphingomonadales bacterium]